ncbi:MAG: alpha/beta hydrolase [Ferruginibacter sp.]
MRRIILCLVIVLLFIMACNNSSQTLQTQKDSTIIVMKDSTSFASGYSAVNGIKMYYEIYGNGEPLVLVHGGGSTIGTTFGSIIPLLAQHYKLIAVDLQAHGHTSDRNTPVSFEQDAEDVATLLKNLDIGKANFFGFSNGGTTCMQVAVSHPELVNKLIIASALFKRNGIFPGFFDMMQHASLKDMPQPLKDAFLKINPDSSKLQVMHDKDKERMLQFKDWKDETLQSVKQPVLIINGDKDVILPEHAVALSKLLPNAQLLIVPATHGSYMGEICSPPENKTIEFCMGIIEDFLNKP